MYLKDMFLVCSLDAWRSATQRGGLSSCTDRPPRTATAGYSEGGGGGGGGEDLTNLQSTLFFLAFILHGDRATPYLRALDIPYKVTGCK